MVQIGSRGGFTSIIRKNQGNVQRKALWFRVWACFPCFPGFMRPPCFHSCPDLQVPKVYLPRVPKIRDWLVWSYLFAFHTRSLMDCGYECDHKLCNSNSVSIWLSPVRCNSDIPKLAGVAHSQRPSEAQRGVGSCRKRVTRSSVQIVTHQLLRLLTHEAVVIPTCQLPWRLVSDRLFL